MNASSTLSAVSESSAVTDKPNHVEPRIFAQLEAPLLGLWAALDLAITNGSSPSTTKPKGRPIKSIDRSELLSKLAAGDLTHDQVVRRYLAYRPIEARTHYNLACYWSARGGYDIALQELAISLEAKTEAPAPRPILGSRI